MCSAQAVHPHRPRGVDALRPGPAWDDPGRGHRDRPGRTCAGCTTRWSTCGTTAPRSRRSAAPCSRPPGRWCSTPCCARRCGWRTRRTACCGGAGPRPAARAAGPPGGSAMDLMVTVATQSFREQPGSISPHVLRRGRPLAGHPAHRRHDPDRGGRPDGRRDPAPRFDPAAAVSSRDLFVGVRDVRQLAPDQREDHHRPAEREPERRGDTPPAGDQTADRTTDHDAPITPSM